MIYKAPKSQKESGRSLVIESKKEIMAAVGKPVGLDGKAN